MIPGMPFDIVIFDFDGTIADTMPFLIRAATMLLAERHGMAPEAATRAYIRTCGLPFVKQIELILPGDGRNTSTVEEFERLKRKHLMEFELFPDALAVVAEIRQAGLKVCLSSGTVESLMLRFLKLKNLDVDLVMGYRPGFEKGREHFGFALNKFNSSSQAAVFVGDSLKDGIAAAGAGIGFIAKTGLVTAGEFRTQLPNVPIVDALEEILPLLGIHQTRERFRQGERSQAFKRLVGDQLPSE